MSLSVRGGCVATAPQSAALHGTEDPANARNAPLSAYSTMLRSCVEKFRFRREELLHEPKPVADRQTQPHDFVISEWTAVGDRAAERVQAREDLRHSLLI